MRRFAALLVLLLPACEEASETDTPAHLVTPEPIGYPEMEANQLHGASCAYASGSSMAPVVIAFPDEAVMKIDGEIRRFSVDAQSEGSELAEESRYLAENRVLLLTIEGDEAQAPERTNLTGTVRLIDGAGAVLYETEGTVQCTGSSVSLPG